MSKHFNDIWCWDLGEGAPLKQEEEGKAILLVTTQNAREGLEEDRTVKEAPEKDALGESWSNHSTQFFLQLPRSS